MTGEEFRGLALSLPGVTEGPHFDRLAFKVRRIFASLSPDGASVNLKLTHEEQAFFAEMSPAVFSRLPNRWGNRGWTQALLAPAEPEDVRAALEAAWRGESVHGRSSTVPSGRPVSPSARSTPRARAPKQS